MPRELKSGSMPKVLASSGTIGTMRGPMPSARVRFRNMRTKAIVVLTDCFPLLDRIHRTCPAVATWTSIEQVRRSGRNRRATLSFLDIGHFLWVVLRVQVGQRLQLLIRELETEPVPKVVECAVVGLLLAVGGVPACERRSESVSLDGTCEDDRRSSPSSVARYAAWMRTGSWPPTSSVSASRSASVRCATRRSSSGVLNNSERITSPDAVIRLLLIAVRQLRESSRKGAGAVCFEQAVP